VRTNSVALLSHVMNIRTQGRILNGKGIDVSSGSRRA